MSAISVQLSKVYRYKGHFREGAWVAIGQVASLTGMILLIRVLTASMSPDEYGKLALGLTLAVMINQTVMGGIALSITRCYSLAQREDDMGGYILGSIRLLGGAALIVAAISIITLIVLNLTGNSASSSIALGALCLSVFQGINASISGIQNAARNRSVVAFHSGLEAWLRIAFVVLLAIFSNLDGALVIVAYICTSAAVSLSQVLFLRGRLPKQMSSRRRNPSWLRQMTQSSLPFACWGGFSFAQQASDRWALEAFRSTYEVGQYVSLYQLGHMPVAILIGMTLTYVAPILYHKSGDLRDSSSNADVHRLGWTIAFIALAVTAIGSVLAALMHTLIFEIAVAPNYRSLSWLLPVMVLAGGIHGTGEIIAIKLVSELRVKDMTMAKITTSLLGLGLNILGAWLAGPVGIAVAILLYSIISLISMAQLGRKSYSHESMRAELASRT